MRTTSAKLNLARDKVKNVAKYSTHCQNPLHYQENSALASPSSILSYIACVTSSTKNITKQVTLPHKGIAAQQDTKMNISNKTAANNFIVLKEDDQKAPTNTTDPSDDNSLRSNSPVSSSLDQHEFTPLSLCHKKLQGQFSSDFSSSLTKKFGFHCSIPAKDNTHMIFWKWHHEVILYTTWERIKPYKAIKEISRPQSVLPSRIMPSITPKILKSCLLTSNSTSSFFVPWCVILRRVTLSGFIQVSYKKLGQYLLDAVRPAFLSSLKQIFSYSHVSVYSSEPQSPHPRKWPTKS